MPSSIWSPVRAARVRWTALLLVALPALACSGSIDGGPSSSAPGSNGGPGSNGTSGAGASAAGPSAPGPARGAMEACKAISPGPSPQRRLTREEFARTVRDLFGPGTPTDFELPDEEQAHGFHNGAENRAVSDGLASRYFAASEKLASAAVGRLGELTGCDLGREGESACLSKLIDGFGTRVWRRPLEPAERSNLERAFNEGKAAGGSGAFADGARAVLQVMLLAPQFIYRLERGLAVPGANHRRLTGWEMASRLSYLLWGPMPDGELLEAARNNRLGSAAEVRAQAERLLRDPRAGELVANFHDQWLRLEELPSVEKDATLHPAWTPELRALLRQESQSFVSEVLWRGDGTVKTLLTAPFTMANGSLASYYGLTGGPGGAAFQKTPLPAGKRSGLLTQAGLLGLTGVPDDSLTSLVFRGLFVRERLLCQEMPDPPPDAADMSPPFTDQTTARQWSQARQANAVCGACHARMDPIGYGLENFDGAGKWRDSDRGQPVNAQGELIDSDVDGPYTGPIELGQRLGGSRQVQDCVARQWFRFGHGRDDTPADACSLAGLQKALADGGGNVRDLLVALTQTDSFLFRQGDQP